MTDQFWSHCMLPIFQLSLNRSLKEKNGKFENLLTLSQVLLLSHSLASRKVQDQTLWVVVLKSFSLHMHNSASLTVGMPEIVSLLKDLRILKLKSG